MDRLYRYIGTVFFLEKWIGCCIQYDWDLFATQFSFHSSDLCDLHLSFTFECSGFKITITKQTTGAGYCFVETKAGKVECP